MEQAHFAVEARHGRNVILRVRGTVNRKRCLHVLQFNRSFALPLSLHVE